MVTLVAAALWGFLVGFVCWEACFRIPEPVAAWLLPGVRANSNVAGIVRMLIVVFALLVVFLAVSLVPLAQVTLALLRSDVEPGIWRPLFGVSYLSSLLGLVALGALRRFAK